MDWWLKLQLLIWLAIFSEGALIFRNMCWVVCQISIYDFVLFDEKVNNIGEYVKNYKNIQISTKDSTKN